MKIAAIVISCFVLLVVPQCGWAGDCSFLQVSFFSPYQLVPAEKDVCGLRLNLPVGENENISGLDLGLVGATNNSYNGIMLNIFGNFNAGGSTKGIELAGVMNFNIGGLNIGTEGGSGTKGIEFAGFLNLNLGDIDGIQIAGLANTGNIDGIQVAGLFNGGGDVRGIQIAGLANPEISMEFRLQVSLTVEAMCEAFRLQGYIMGLTLFGVSRSALSMSPKNYQVCRSDLSITSGKALSPSCRSLI